MDLGGNEGRIEVVLLQHGSEKLSRIKGFLVFPEEFPLVDDPAAAHVEDGDRQHGLFAVIAEDVDVVIAGRCHLLAFGEVLHGFDRVAVMSRNFELLLLRGLFHALPKPLDQIALAAFEKELHVLDGFLVLRRRCQAVHARAEAAVDVVLQARPRALSVDRDRAVADQEIPLDQPQRLARQASGKERSGIVSAVLPHPAGDHGARIGLVDGQLDVGIGLVVFACAK